MTRIGLHLTKEVLVMNARAWIADIGLAAMLIAPGNALAAPQCFQVFSGVYVMFNRPVTTTGTSALNGRIFGALSPCAGFQSWPIVGSSHKSAANGLVVSFRTFNVDAANCGAVDWIGTMSGNPLSGSFQLWNQRTLFGNTGTWTQVSPCPAPPVPTLKVGETDALGNSAK
jgi:hypothetical protein